MSTRSRIGIVKADGSVVSIYCHNDGYLSWVGDTLLKHYTDRAKVESLISLGDISSLHENVDPDPKGGKTKNYDSWEPKNVDANGEHTFDHPQVGVVVAYARDRGEDPEDVKPRIDKDVDTFVKSDVEEYGYLFTQDGTWLVIDGHVGIRQRKAVPLTTELVRDSPF